MISMATPTATSETANAIKILKVSTHSLMRTASIWKLAANGVPHAASKATKKVIAHAITIPISTQLAILKACPRKMRRYKKRIESLMVARAGIWKRLKGNSSCNGP